MSDDEDGGNQAELAQNVKEFAKHTEQQPTKRNSYLPPRPSFGDAYHVEVDRTNLEAILDDAHRLKTKKSKKSTSTLALATETYKDKQVNKTCDQTCLFILFVELEVIWEILQAKAKEARNDRIGSLKTQHRYLLESCALFWNKPVEYILVGNL